MAAKPATYEVQDDGTVIVEWAGLANGDTGDPVQCAHYERKCVQVTGTFGVAGQVDMEGSNNAASPSYAAIGDVYLLAAASATDTSLLQLAHNPVVVRPNVSAGDGTTLLTITMVMAKKGV